MRAWKGWTATSAAGGNTAPTWDEWRAQQRRVLSREQLWRVHQQESSPFSARELAHLSFVRWLHQRGHLGLLDPRDPARNDTV